MDGGLSVSAPRKYPDAVYDELIRRYVTRKETLKTIAWSLKVNYNVAVKWICQWRKGNARKPLESVER
jgi:transposase-like protein